MPHLGRQNIVLQAGFRRIAAGLVGRFTTDADCAEKKTLLLGQGVFHLGLLAVRRRSGRLN
jgi:hypothetical protein